MGKGLAFLLLIPGEAKHDDVVAVSSFFMGGVARRRTEKMALVPANGPFQLTRPPHLAHHRHPSRRCYCEVGRPDGGWGCRSRHLGKGLQDRRVTGIVVLSRLAQRLKLFRSDPTC
ncbi:hypothetical protein BHE74_00033246 [Ensete ventricosum]|nr:hypothetical protein BHE74_00033246 [Ensete ventricosum]